MTTLKSFCKLIREMRVQIATHIHLIAAYKQAYVIAIVVSRKLRQ
jgi:hypothetical protein